MASRRLALLFCFAAAAAHPRPKRADIDLQTCIGNFDVHRDKIIRTQDSQMMGAKFLNEIDLGSREECLRLCCETEDCDVFVFEEKNSGSCYLFHCGPPKDFKCKFTHHVNYSSAILSINRYLPDLESQIKLTKHEQDLTKLRKPEAETEVLRPETVRTTPSTTTTTVITKEVIPVLGKSEEGSSEARQTSSKCSGFQFACRSTGECIAIYNACDGIVQCSDGSDEALELGCPAPQLPDGQSGAAVGVPIRQATPRAEPDTPIRAEGEAPKPDEGVAKPEIGQEGEGVSRERQSLQELQVQPAPVVYEPNVQPHYDARYPKLSPPAQYHPLPAQDQHQPPPLPIQPEPDFVRPAPDLSRAGLGPRVPYDPRYMPQAQQQQPWIPHQSNQMPAVPQLPPYQDKTGRVYGRKEADQDLSQLQYQEGINYPKIPNYYGDNYRQAIQQENWPVGGEDVRYSNQARYPQESLQMIPPDPSRKEQSAYKLTTAAQQPQPVNINKATDTGVNPKHVQDKMAHDLKHSKATLDHATNSNTKDKKTKGEEHQHHSKYPDVVAYKLTDSEDGVAKTPRGAVLALTVGVVIACVMAILIGCRLKVGRRYRKAGKSYAHDADFLVNGMYL